MKKVLLIEDDMALRENTAELLELSNFNVLTAADGKMGIQEAKKSLPDIIVCDIMMPEVDGYEVLQNLAVHANTKHIPFIFLSAKTEHKDIRKGMDMGADDYLTKPFDEDELISAIESRLAKVAIMLDNENKTVQTTPKIEGNLKSLNDLRSFFKAEGDFDMYKANEAVYDEGKRANYIYLIDKGVVKNFRMDEYGKELITGLHKENDFFGYVSFADNSPYQESAMVLENAEVYKMTRGTLKDLLQENYEVTLDLINYLTDNLASFKDQLVEMAYSSVRRKTANTILKFVEKLKAQQQEGIKISRSDLASVAGIATESLIRALSSLKRDGLIEIKGRTIKVLNAEALREVE